MSSSVGKVSVGTGPCFLSMSFRKSRSDSSITDFWVPTQTYSQAAVSHPFLHCSPVSSLVSFPLLCCSQSLLCCSLEGAFFRTWPRLRWHAGFPRSPALPPELLLAHRSEQEGCATRPWRVCANLGWLCWISIVLHGIHVKDHAPSVSSEEDHQ